MRSNVLDPKRVPPQNSYKDYSLPNQVYQPAQRPYGAYPDPARSAAPRPGTARRFRLRLVPEEGWLAFLLLAAALYSVVGSVITAGWVDHGQLLFISPLAGLVVGFVIAKIARFSQVVLHLGAILAGHWLAIWLTGSFAFHIPWWQLLDYLRSAFSGQLGPGSAVNDIVFFFYLTFLTYFLGYFGGWLIYRARLPWLVALVYFSILLVNLNYIKQEYIPYATYLTILLAGALVLLIARIQLATQILQWKKDGLHTDRGWMRSISMRCMQVAGVLTVLVLLVGWLLPFQQQPSSGKNLWDRFDTIWNNAVKGNLTWDSLTGQQPVGNFFGDQLTISGSVRLPSGEVLYYASSSGPHYLGGFTFEQFDGHTWTTAATTNGTLSPANAALTDATGSEVTTTVTMTQPPNGTKSYIFAPPQPYKFSVPVIVLNNGPFQTAWIKQDPFKIGEKYQVVSDVLSDPKAVMGMPLPENDPDTWRGDPNYAALARYLDTPKDLSPAVARTTQEWTRGAQDAYSALHMLEARLSDQKQFTYSIDNPPIPANIDVVDWLLSQHRGYCTYYASAMAIMARQLHIPTRIINGFSQGRFDSQRKVYSVVGSDAHSWVQAYFPGYGWINFDPTPGFSAGAAPQKENVPTVKPTTPALKPGATVTPVIKPRPPLKQDSQAALTGNHTNNSDLLNSTALMGVSFGALFISLLVFVIAICSYWWRNLYASSSFVAGVFWRLCWLASRAGLAPKSWQTPYEYSRTLAQQYPQHAPALWRLTELFVRDRWGSSYQSPAVHEEELVEQLWPALRGTFVRSLLSRFKKR